MLFKLRRDSYVTDMTTAAVVAADRLRETIREKRIPDDSA